MSMSSENAPAPEIMNVRQIIEYAFGDFEENAVNFKLVQTVLFLIARQLRLLERRVQIELRPLQLLPSDSTLSVTEVKIHAMQKKKHPVKKPDEKPGARAKPGTKPVVRGAKSGVGGAKPGVGGAKPGVGGAKPGVGGAKSGVGAAKPGLVVARTGSPKERKTDRASKSSTDKTSAEKSSTDKTSSADKTTSSGEKTSTDQTSSTIKTSSTDKSSSQKTTSSDKTSTEKTSSSRMTSFSKDIDKEQQRAASVEEGKKDATPFASLSSVQEAQYEKLLVVKKVPSKEAREADSQQGKKSPPLLSLVTQEQFEDLADVVRKLEKKFLPIGTPGFPEHAELMEELRRGASLTDAMAALQLSARLEATEKALAQMISMVTELALETPGLELDSDTRAYLGLPGGTAQKGLNAMGISARSGVVEGGRTKSGKGTRAKGGKGISAASDVQSTTITPSQAVEATETETQATVEKAEGDHNRIEQYVTFLDLQAAAKEVHDDLLKKVKTLTARTSGTAENAYKLSLKLESKLNSSLNVSSQMANLENLVKQYAEQITALDTGLSSQMTNYQEQLTQMQLDLEIGLDNMAEVFGNAGGDVDAMAELHSHFTGLQVDLESMAFRQKELKDAQDSTAYDLENLWKEIEMLRDTKSDREEVADALRDKAGIGELNGLVSIQQFEAVEGDFEKRISDAYDTFNNQEYVWQKAIDDMLKLFYEKADVVQIQSLKDDIQKYLNRMEKRMQVIADIVGEPKSAVLSKKVFRDTSCLACGSPAYMDIEEASKVPALPKFPSARQPAEGAEAETKTKGGGDNRPCYPDQPIPHPRDPSIPIFNRSHICKRYCGGSHTVLTDGLNRAPQSLIVQPQRPFNTAPGTDGKLYMVDEETAKIPCLACNNLSQPTAVASERLEPHKQASIDSIDGTGNFSATPPAQNISYN